MRSTPSAAFQLLIFVCVCFGGSFGRLQRQHSFLQIKQTGTLLWSVSLEASQCPNGVPCFNIYAVNQTQGQLNWFAYSTNSQGIKGFSLGKHAIYYSTWSGPGLYAVNAASGHVRWQFPLENWFKYWVKEIDLPSTASFAEANEVKDVVFVTAAGPASRVYGLKTKSGTCAWEFKAPNSSVQVVDLAMPTYVSSLHRRLVFLALNSPSSNTSWVQALDVATGSSVWQSDVVVGALLDRLELDGCCRLLATSSTANALFAFNISSGRLIWRRRMQYCSAPSPIEAPYGGELLLPSSCDVLSGLSLIDASSGKSSWENWDVPNDAAPVGNCSWMAVKDGGIVFGCSCNIQSRRNERHSAFHNRHQQQEGLQAEAAAAAAAAASASMTAVPQRLLQQEASEGHLMAEPGLCLYSVRMRSGKLDWVLPVAGNLSFPSAAQAWGMAPLLHQGLAIFLATTQVLAVDSFTGRVAWLLPLADGEAVHGWLQPALDPVRNILVVPAQRTSNRTAITAVNVADGKLLWHKVLNGTGQVPAGAPGAAEPQRLLLEADRVYVEACKGMTCCLRALNVLTGKQVWGMCLDAQQGQDATHPHAQFAIWLITLITIGSICLLILGACMVYVHRWNEERAILYGQGDSPRHTHRPLPDREGQSDSEGEDADSQDRRQSFISCLRQAQAAVIGSGGRQPLVQQGVIVPPQSASGYVPVSAVPAAAYSRQHVPRVGGGDDTGRGAWVPQQQQAAA